MNLKEIGNQIWEQEDLYVIEFKNGDEIPRATTLEAWNKASEENLPAYYLSDAGGKLYNWYAINDKRGLAPEGWRIPTALDWDTLINELGGGEFAVQALKSKNGWPNGNNGENTSGFFGFPTGALEIDGTFSYDDLAYYWSQSEINTDTAWRYMLGRADKVEKFYGSKG